MICEVCKKTFKPDSDIERLMAVGQIARLCSDCVVQPHKPVAIPLAPTSSNTAQMVLRRIEWCTENNRVIRFMSLPPKRNRDTRHNTLRKPRKSDQHVFIISEGGNQMPTSPPVRINCNVDTFQRQRAKFRVMKTPNMWDAFTGVAKMEVPFTHISHIDREFDMTTVHLKNGEFIRLRYS